MASLAPVLFSQLSLSTRANRAALPAAHSAAHPLRGRGSKAQAGALLLVGCCVLSGALPGAVWAQADAGAAAVSPAAPPAAPPAAAPAAGQPYQVDVWADALFGPDGQLQRLEVPEADQYPAAFVARLKQQFAKARIPPVTDDDGSPATFQTGLGLDLTVTPGADGDARGTVRIDGVRVAARPVKRYAASAPAEVPINAAGGSGSARVTLRCTVSTEGRCADTEIVSISAGSESFRRWGLASMEGWLFEPQRVNGRPVPSQWQQTLVLERRATMPRNFRDPRRL